MILIGWIDFRVFDLPHLPFLSQSLKSLKLLSCLNSIFNSRLHLDYAGLNHRVQPG